MAVKKFGNGGVVGAVVVDGYDDVSDGDGDQGSLVRGATAIESDCLMAKDRTATYEMGLQRIRCREHVANFIFTLLLLFNIIIILTTTILLGPTQDKNKQRHLTWACPPPGQPRQARQMKAPTPAIILLEIIIIMMMRMTAMMMLMAMMMVKTLMFTSYLPLPI